MSNADKHKQNQERLKQARQERDAISLRKAKNQVKAAKKPGGKLPEAYSQDYRGDSMLSHIKKLEEENKQLKFALAGEKRVEEEQTAPVVGAIMTGVIIAVILIILFAI